MSTSLTDLLDAVTRQADHDSGAPSLASADAAALALGPAGLALHRLAADGLGHTHPLRDQLVRDLGDACLAASVSWRGSAPGRVTELMAASSDVVGRLRAEFSSEGCWSTAIAIGEAARHCAAAARGHIPYANAPELRRVHRAAAALERPASLQPPSRGQSEILARRVPVEGLPPGLPGAAVAAEAAAWLVDQLRRDGPAHPLNLRGAIAITYAAEAASDHLVDLLRHTPGAATSGDQWLSVRNTGRAWRSVRAALGPFDDGSRRETPPLVGVTLWAARLAEGLHRERVDQAAEPVEGREQQLGRADLDALQVVASSLPLIARELESITDGWVQDEQLVARARDLDATRNDRVRAVIEGRLVTADGLDLVNIVGALRQAELLGAGLASTADRSGGRSPVPPGYSEVAAIAPTTWSTPRAPSKTSPLTMTQDRGGKHHPAPAVEVPSPRSR